MKTTCLLLVLCLLPGIFLQIAYAQTSTYQPGKWYIGLRAESYSMNRNVRPQGIESESIGLCALAGRRLSSHFDLQLGLMAASQPSDYHAGLVENAYSGNPHITGRGYIGRTLYAPLTVKYVPFSSQRRFQPYLSAGFTTLVGTARLVEEEGGTVKTISETTQLSLNGLIGLGLQVRTINRVHLFLQYDQMRPVYQGGKGACLSTGLVYDFRSR